MESGLSAAVGELLDVEVEAMSDAEIHEALVGATRDASRLAVAVARLAAAWDSRKTWADDGSRAPWARLAREAGLSPASAKRLMHRARRLRSMPGTEAAVADGRLSIDKADLLIAANQPELQHFFAEQEPMLVEQCSTLRYTEALTATRYWSEIHHDLAGTRRELPGYDRHVTAVRTLHGTVHIDGLLDPIGGTAFINELGRLEQIEFDRDLAEARNEHGDDFTLDQLRRSPAQRRADAAVEMAKRSALVSETAPTPRLLISVLCGYDGFAHICELADGTVIAPRQVVPHLGEADIQRIVFDSPSEVIEVGERERFFTGALRRAIEVRDRHCTHSCGCDVPAEQCQIDHVVEYSQGGLTVQENGRAYCKPHNLQRNRRPDAGRSPPDAG